VSLVATRTALSYRPEGASAAGGWEDDGGRSDADPPALAVPETAAPPIPEGLDWTAFSAGFFPGRRRHDFEAVKAYEAYRNGDRQLPSRLRA
jgi:hypothetical protein